MVSKNPEYTKEKRTVVYLDKKGKKQAVATHMPFVTERKIRSRGGMILGVLM